MKSATARRAAPSTAVEKIMKGAVEAFLRLGPRKASMADIADAAGVGRQTVYRQFKNKQAIIEMLFEHRVRSLLQSMEGRQRSTVDLEDRIIDTSLEWVRLIKQDLVLKAIISETDSHETELFLVAGRSDLQKIAAQIWEPILKQARQAGALRPQLIDPQAIQYVRATHYILHLRDDLKERERVEFVKDTLLTTLLRDERNKYAKAKA
jgi:TetR/AcrR family transcriptional repressor of uid operon